MLSPAWEAGFFGTELLSERPGFGLAGREISPGEEESRGFLSGWLRLSNLEPAASTALNATNRIPPKTRLRGFMIFSIAVPHFTWASVLFGNDLQKVIICCCDGDVNVSTGAWDCFRVSIGAKAPVHCGSSTQLSPAEAWLLFVAVP